MCDGRHPAYQAALDADEHFQHELVRVYGEKAAGDMRYQSTAFEDVSLIAARHAKLAADEVWRGVMRTTNATGTQTLSTGEPA